jgi:hypothetical protein
MAAPLSCRTVPSNHAHECPRAATLAATLSLTTEMRLVRQQQLEGGSTCQEMQVWLQSYGLCRFWRRLAEKLRESERLLAALSVLLAGPPWEQRRATPLAVRSLAALAARPSARRRPRVGTTTDPAFTRRDVRSTSLVPARHSAALSVICAALAVACADAKSRPGTDPETGTTASVITWSDGKRALSIDCELPGDCRNRAFALCSGGTYTVLKTDTLATAGDTGMAMPGRTTTVVRCA